MVEMTEYMKFISLSRYSRWLEDENRRESWDEVVDRYIGFMKGKIDSDQIPWQELRDAIYNLDVMPSMRCLMSAGAALDRDNVAGYNCAYLPVDSPRSFDEALYILMCGTGVGFSVERQYVNELPLVNEHFERSQTTIVVEDSKAGWARAFRELIGLLYSGQEPRWDLSKLRPAGSRLKTFGGRSSGPGPLDDLFRFAVGTLRGAAGRRLNSLECHDIMCKIGQVVVVGGVRRSAMISLSNLSDPRMRDAKKGDLSGNVQRYLSNNSVCYTENPDVEIFMDEWISLVKSKNGERGIFNRKASQAQAAKNGRRKADVDFGTNPCSEIILRPYQFCNLSEVVVRADDDEDDLWHKVRLAAILGTLQSTLTDFKYLRKVWTKNTEEERLLGVSLTGVLDHPWLADNIDVQKELRDIVIETNAQFAELLSIPQSTATTCVKPSGTVSQLVDAASGMHPRWSPFYIRTVRGDNKDPLTQFLISKGIPNEPDQANPQATTVFSFPQRAPEGAKTRRDFTATSHLNIWLALQDNWCEHKPSVTVNVKQHEWPEVQAWVWEHFDRVSGISFLPYADHNYAQAPYQEITEDEYNAWIDRMPPPLDWSELSLFEKEDTTTGSQELACSGGSCELVDIGR